MVVKCKYLMADTFEKKRILSFLKWKICDGPATCERTDEDVPLSG